MKIFAGADLSCLVRVFTRKASSQEVREGSQPPTPLDACSTLQREADRPGQEVTKTPSAAYVKVAQRVQDWIREYEGKS